jgi:hypothetical protein
MHSSDQDERTQYVKDVLGRFYLDDLTSVVDHQRTA